MPQKLRPVGQN